jgi:hypothetical protein
MNPISQPHILKQMNKWVVSVYSWYNETRTHTA